MSKSNGRTCGSCTACSRLPEVGKKPHGQNGGFACAWLKGFGDEADRPNKSKVIVSFVDNTLPGGVLRIWGMCRRALSGEFARETILWAVSNGVWVSQFRLRNDTRGKLLVPRGRIATKEVLAVAEKNNLEIGDG
ncbi:MAG: hypothetical protein HY432_02990 [Candidatus Liptonbacteria bacterium]|nr:hypothetical protein [Candidatus Liptonbacteria bacterium]